VDGIKQAIGEISARLPKGINLDVVLDQSVYVRKAIRSLKREAGLGTFLAGLMILIFIGSLRSTVAILMSPLFRFWPRSLDCSSPETA